jgi:tyrosine-protein kinase Etk/Wzc
MNDTDKFERAPSASPTDPESNREGSELSRLLGVISESRWLIVGITAIVLVLGILYSLNKTPVYQSQTILRVVQPTRSAGSLTLMQLSALVMGAPLPTQTEIELLQTRTVLEPVVKKLHLDIRVQKSGGIPIIGTFFGHRHPLAKISKFDVPNALKGETFTVVTNGNGHYRLLSPDGKQILQGKIGASAAGRVNTGDGAGLVNLQIDSIADGANRFTLVKAPAGQAVGSLLESLQIEELGRQSGMVQVTMQGTSPRFITAALNALGEANVQQNIVQNSAQAAKQIDFLNEQLPELEKRLVSAQTKLADFLSKHPTLALSQNGQYLVGLASTIEQQIGPLQAQLSEARSSLGASNPQVKALRSQLAGLQEQRKQLYAKVAKLPKGGQTLIRMQSAVTIAQGLYSTMLNQFEALQVAKAGTVANVAVVDPAITPSSPILPNRPLDILVALIVGLLLGFAAAFVRRSLRRGVEDPHVIEQRLDLPVLAALPHSRQQRRIERHHADESPGVGRLLAAHGTDDAAVEGLRSLRMGLQLVPSEAASRIVGVTSLSPGEGKSFVSSNLAYLLAQGGTRTLLLDADLRRGHMHRYFGWSRGKGLSEYLAGEAERETVIRRTTLSNLNVVTTGALPDDAANLWMRGNATEVLQRLCEGYDFVLLDLPPVLAAGDAFVVARMTTDNLLMIKPGMHSLRQLQMEMKRFARHGITLTGTVMNDISARTQRYAYHGYGYQYHYNYSSGSRRRAFSPRRDR